MTAAGDLARRGPGCCSRAEVVTGDFVLLMLGGGALAAAVASLLGPGWSAARRCSPSRRCCCSPGARRCARRLERAHAAHADAAPRRWSAAGDGRGARSTGTAAGSSIGDDEWSARAVRRRTGDRAGRAGHRGRISGATALVLADRSSSAPDGKGRCVDGTHRSARRRPAVRAARRRVRGQGGADHPAGPGRGDRTARPLPADADPGPGVPGAVHRPGPRPDRPARAGGLVPAAAGDHRRTT